MLFGAVEGWGFEDQRFPTSFWSGSVLQVASLNIWMVPKRLEILTNLVICYNAMTMLTVWEYDIDCVKSVPQDLFPRSRCFASRKISSRNALDQVLNKMGLNIWPAQRLRDSSIRHWPHDFSCLHALSGLCRNHGTARSILRRSNSKSLRSIKLLDGSSWHCSNARVDINPKPRKVKTTQKHGVYYGTDYTYIAIMQTYANYHDSWHLMTKNEPYKHCELPPDQNRPFGPSAHLLHKNSPMILTYSFVFYHLFTSFLHLFSFFHIFFLLNISFVNISHLLNISFNGFSSGQCSCSK